MKKANHTAPIVRIGTIHPHPNADKLEITYVMDGAYQVVTGKGNFKEGDLAVYVQPDSVVPQIEAFKFIWGDHVGIDGLVPEKRRRITVKKLRKEYSEGLLMPISDFRKPVIAYDTGIDAEHNLAFIKEGDDVSDIIGITHYEPQDTLNTQADTAAAPRRRYPQSLRGWFFFLLHKLGLRGVGGKSLALDVSFQSPTYDVDAQKNYRRAFKHGEPVLVTEKIHGSNWRAVNIDGVQYVGSHYQWKQQGDNAFWNALTPEIEEYCAQNQGTVVYGELTPTQKGYSYGTEKPTVFPFDTYNPQRGWSWAGNEGLTNTPPTIYAGPYDEALLEEWSTGKSLVPGADHIREGCCIRTVPERSERGLGRVHLKVVSKAYLEKEGK